MDAVASLGFWHTTLPLWPTPRWRSTLHVARKRAQDTPYWTAPAHRLAFALTGIAVAAFTLGIIHLQGIAVDRAARLEARNLGRSVAYSAAVDSGRRASRHITSPVKRDIHSPAR